nr:unnamed protein product [Haemonchus contortus]
MLSVLWSCPVCKRVIHKENLYLHLPVAQFYTEETGEELKSEDSFASHKSLAEHCKEEHADERADGESPNHTLFTISSGNKREFDVDSKISSLLLKTWRSPGDYFRFCPTDVDFPKFYNGSVHHALQVTPQVESAYFGNLYVSYSNQLENDSLLP